MAAKKTCCSNGLCPACSCCICVCTKKLSPEARRLLRKALK